VKSSSLDHRQTAQLTVTSSLMTHACFLNIYYAIVGAEGPGYFSRFSDSLLAGRFGNRIPMGRDFP